MFTVPPGGDGLYYFNINLITDEGEDHGIALLWNNGIQCMAAGEQEESGAGDYPASSCSVVIMATAGHRYSN